MKEDDLKARLNHAISEVVRLDSLLLEYNLSERCIAARLAIYLQAAIPEYSVDVEYNRHGRSPKALALPEECANYRTRNGEPLVIPDVIVHERGSDDANILVLELKKTTNTNTIARGCDHRRIHAFQSQLHYRFAALIECETRLKQKPAMWISEWLPPAEGAVG